MLASLTMLLDNDKTALSCNSGTAFPTADLQPGMLCFRSDSNKLFQLLADKVTWRQIADLSSDLSAQLVLKAAIASPTFTGTPKAPTAAAATNTTQIATTAFVTTAVSDAVSSLMGGAATTALDTLKELGDALGNDANFAASMTNALASKFDKAGGVIAGTVTVNNTVTIAGTAGRAVALEIGNLDGTASTPYIDFHSGAVTVDYDARIIATSGTGTVGKGALEFIAGSFRFTGGNITGALTGNASTATKLQTARTINGVAFDGGSNITVSWVGQALTTTGTDLNSIQDEGPYYCSANATATTFLNSPTKNAFSLRVWKAAGVIQELTEYMSDNNRKTYQRAYYGVNAWSDWVQILASNNAPVTSLVTSTTATGTTNVATTNTNTFLNVVDAVPGNAAVATGSSTQITGAGTITVTSDAAGKLTITGAQTITGNAATATKLATARTITIGNASASFDGSGNVTFAPTDIGGFGPNVLLNSSAENTSTQAGRAQFWAVGGSAPSQVVSLVDSALGGKGQRIEVAAANAGQYIELRNGGDSSITPSEPGKVWTLSVYARGTAGMDFRMYVQAIDSTGKTIGTASSTPAVMTEGFQRYTMTTRAIDAPAGTVRVNVYLGRLINNTAVAAPLWMEVDNVQLQEGAWSSPYAPNPNEGVFGQGAWLDKTVDLNALVTPGLYFTQQGLSTQPNGPAGITFWGAIRVSRVDARIIQEAFGDTAPYTSLMRVSTNGGSVWKAWSAVQLADSATKLATARTINGVAFDGTGNVTINAPWLDNTDAAGAMATGTAQPTRASGLYVDGIYGGTANGYPINYGNRLQVVGHKGIAATEIFHDWANGSGSRLFVRSRGDVATHTWSAAREVLFKDGDASADRLTSGTIPNARMSGTYDGMSLKVNGANTVFSDPSAGNSNTSARVIFGMASYRNSSNTATGAIVFTAPTNASAIMHELEVSVMTYSPARVAKILANGYRSSATAFSNTATVQLGSQAVQVRWGIDADGKTCLILGDVGTVWSYPHASASIGMVSHTGAVDSYCTGWTANMVTDLSTYTGIVSPADTPVTTDIAGNAATASSAAKLTTTRAINGTNFDGTAAITTANWGTARTITIGSTGKSVNGSANVAWTLAEIGAAAAAHSHGEYFPAAGGVLAGPITLPTFAQSWIAGTSGTSSIRFSDASTSGSWHAWLSQRTAGGNAYAIGQLGENFYLNFATAANISAGNNATTAVTVWDGAGNMTAAGNVTAYSDRRLKKNIKRIGGALGKVKTIGGYTYTRKDTGADQAGLIAQEIQKVLPQAVLVGSDKKKTLSVSYGSVTGLLVEAIKELDAKLEKALAVIAKQSLAIAKLASV